MKILEELPKGVLQPIEKHVQFEDPFMTRLMESLDRLNTRMEQIEKKMDQIIPPKIADSVSIIKDLISREVEEPTVPPTTPSLGSAINSL
jgi:hypothetical protein